MNFRTLDLNLLRVFDSVMAEGSLTRAADALAITQPAASHALKRLHAAVGDTLFVRTAFGMKPTPKAEALWPQVRAALGSLQRALAPEDFDPRRDEASFRLSMADASAALLAPPLMAALQAQQARATVRMLPLTTRDPRHLLQHGEADLAIGQFPEAVAALQADGAQAAQRHLRLHVTRHVCVMRLGHPLAGQPLTLEAYCGAAHLLVSFSGRPHGAVDHALASLGLQRRVVLTVNQFFTAGRVVAQSDLLTVLPLSFVAATGSQAQVVVRELPFELPPVAVEMIWPLRLDADPGHRWLRGLIEQAAAVGALAGERAAT
jgi:DNA-binding transcriptional LysR family regulator